MNIVLAAAKFLKKKVEYKKLIFLKKLDIPGTLLFHYFVVKHEWLHFSFGVVYADKCANRRHARVDGIVVRFAVMIMFRRYVLACCLTSVWSLPNVSC